MTWLNPLTNKGKLPSSAQPQYLACGWSKVLAWQAQPPNGVMLHCTVLRCAVVRPAQEASSKAHGEFIKLAARQHSFAPDSQEYQQQVVQVEAALASLKEQFLAAVQATASQTATAAAATLGKA